MSVCTLRSSAKRPGASGQPSKRALPRLTNPESVIVSPVHLPRDDLRVREGVLVAGRGPGRGSRRARWWRSRRPPCAPRPRTRPSCLPSTAVKPAAPLSSESVPKPARGEEARLRGGAREDLHHAADRVGAVEARQRALHHLDALDHVEGQVLDGGGAHRGRAHAQAVDEHERLAGVGAAQEEARRLARRRRCRGTPPSASRCSSSASGDGARAVDLVARDDRHVAQRVDGALRAAGGGDDHRVEGLEGEAWAGDCWAWAPKAIAAARPARGLVFMEESLVRAGQRPRRPEVMPDDVPRSAPFGGRRVRAGLRARQT